MLRVEIERLAKRDKREDAMRLADKPAKRLVPKLWVLRVVEARKGIF
jgi:hypothetical protein